MFSRFDVVAFFLRIIVFMLVFSAFPILFHFFRAALLKVIFGDGKGNQEGNGEGTYITAKKFNITTCLILLVPLLVSVFYPQIASILGYVGSICGLFAVYLIPVLTHLSKL